MKPFDVIIIFLLVALSFSPMAIFAVQNSQNEGNKIYAVISIDGEEVDRFLLTGNEEHKLITCITLLLVNITSSKSMEKEFGTRKTIARNKFPLKRVGYKVPVRRV